MRAGGQQKISKPSRTHRYVAAFDGKAQQLHATESNRLTQNDTGNQRSGRRGRGFKSRHPDQGSCRSAADSLIVLVAPLLQCPILGAKWEPILKSRFDYALGPSLLLIKGTRRRRRVPAHTAADALLSAEVSSLPGACQGPANRGTLAANGRSTMTL